MRTRPVAAVGTAALLASLALVPAAAATPDEPVVVASDLDGDPVGLLAYENAAPTFSSAGDGFGVFQRDVSDSIPFSLLDDSAAGFPSDSLGIIGASQTGRFFGATDTENADNTGPVTATWTFDVAGVEAPLFLNVDAGAMGDFEASGDTFAFAAGFDGAAPTDVMDASVDEATSRSYTLDDGDTFDLDDPIDLAGTPLDDDLVTVSAALAGVGDTLTVSFTAQTNGGSEAFAFDSLVITQGAPLADGDEPEPAPTCDATEITLVSDVQGAGDTSPLTGSPVYVPGEPVTVRAVATLVVPQLGGFFVQEESGDVDDDPATSEGVFVDGPAPAGLVAGDTVEVTGGVSENFDRTQLNADETAVCDVEAATIDPTALALPATTTEREQVEGMLVETVQDLYVTSLFTAYQHGELGVALDGPLTQPTSEFAPDDPRAEELAEANADSLLLIDDRGEFGFDNAPWFHDVRRRAGDVVPAGVVGALDFSFGAFKIEPRGEFPEIVQVEARPAAPALDGGHDIGAFNVLNYFNTFGNSDVLRGARNQGQFDLQSTKVVEAITLLDPAVLGIVEVENDYEDHYDGDPDTVPSMQTLVDRLNAAAGAGTYDWVVPDADDLVDEGLGGGGLGTDAIAVGLIYQPDRATEVGDPATFDIDAQLTELTEMEDEETGDAEENESFSNGDKNRWPLAQTFRVKGRDMTVVVNHLKSKGSSCAFVDGPTFDPGDDVGSDLTGNCNLTRTYAAQQLVDWVDEHPTGVTTSNAFVVGDLNSYEEEAPIEVLVDAGYADLVQELGDDAATYKFDGRYGRLDYVMASPAAMDLVRDTAVWQANSAEPYGYLYYLDPVDASAYASSDHDPVVVSLQPDGPPARVGPPPWAPGRGG